MQIFKYFARNQQPSDFSKVLHAWVFSQIRSFHMRRVSGLEDVLHRKQQRELNVACGYCIARLGPRFYCVRKPLPWIFPWQKLSYFSISSKSSRGLAHQRVSELWKMLFFICRAASWVWPATSSWWHTTHSTSAKLILWRSAGCHPFLCWLLTTTDRFAFFILNKVLRLMLLLRRSRRMGQEYI